MYKKASTQDGNLKGASIPDSSTLSLKQVTAAFSGATTLKQCVGKMNPNGLLASRDKDGNSKTVTYMSEFRGYKEPDPKPITIVVTYGVHYMASSHSCELYINSSQKVPCSVHGNIELYIHKSNIEDPIYKRLSISLSQGESDNSSEVTLSSDEDLMDVKELGGSPSSYQNYTFKYQ